MQKKYPKQKGSPYQGKVRDVYDLGSVLLSETTNRISAFDVILPFEVKNKGAVLNQLTRYFMEKTKDIIPNCILDVPTDSISIWRKTMPYKFEVVVRAYNTGSFWRNYGATKKQNPWKYDISKIGENQRFSKNLITPTTKADNGSHDEDISLENILKKGLATKKELDYIVSIANKLFSRGQVMAEKRGLILVDTKYEFGKDDQGTIYLIDEIHTPDSSRYWYKDDYVASIKERRDPKSLSKEFLRQWLIKNNFKGNKTDKMPKFPKEFIASITDRYLELYTVMTGEKLSITDTTKEENYKKVMTSLAKVRPQFESPRVGIVMGSQSDLSIMQKTCDVLDLAGVSYTVDILSAHRTPDDLKKYTDSAFKKGIQIIVAGAGGAAHLPGMIASNTVLPVVGIPIKSKNSIDGVDSLFSIVQMPAGVPVATMAIDGGDNAGLFVLQILALNDLEIRDYMLSYKKTLKDKVSNMRKIVAKDYVRTL